MTPPAVSACFQCRRTILVAAPGEEKRKLDVFVPIGADDGDKIILEGEGHLSKFQGECEHINQTLENITTACCKQEALA